MRRLRALLVRFINVFKSRRQYTDAMEELQVHRDLLSAEYERSGMTPEEARRRAAADFGSISAVASGYRDRQGLPRLEHVIRNGRRAIWALLRTPGLSLSMMLVLGLGIGLSTASVAVFHAIMWADLPVVSPEAVVRISQEFDAATQRQGELSQFSYQDLGKYRNMTRAMAAVAGVSHTRLTWHQDSGRPMLDAELVTGDYFGVLPVTPVLGRVFTAAESRETVAVISYRLWTDTFEADPGILGRTMWLAGSVYTIIGVAPRSFFGSGLASVNLWLPLEAVYATRNESILSSDMGWLQVLGRLAPAESLATARAEANVIARRFDESTPGRPTAFGIATASRVDVGATQSVSSVAVVSAIILVLLLLICGSNAASLLLARGVAQQREVAIRLAVGAARSDILGQLAVEVGLIAIASAAIGLLVCFGALHTLAGSLPMPDILLGIQPDFRVFGFALGAAAVVALLSGLAPAAQALRVDCIDHLNGRSPLFRRNLPAVRSRRALISAQITVSTVLILTAILLGRGASQAWRADLGYATKGLYIIQPDGSWETGLRPADRGQFGERITYALREMPGIIAVGRATLAPFSGTGRSEAAPNAGTLEPVHFNQIDDGFFMALGVPFLTGRAFLPQEDDAVIVNAALARRFWVDERSAVGQTLLIAGRGRNARPRPMRVIAVVPTLQTTKVGIPDGPTYYTLLTTEEIKSAFVVVRAEGDVGLHQLVWSIDTEAQGVLVTALDTRLLEMTAPARTAVAAVGSVGLLALFIAAVGIHGVIAYTVTCRTREIGIYQALGAKPVQLIRLIVGWTMRGVAVGVTTALLLMMIAAAVLGATFRELLNGLNPLDAESFFGALLLLVCVVGIAAYFPVRRALRMTPLEALRRG